MPVKQCTDCLRSDTGADTCPTNSECKSNQICGCKENFVLDETETKCVGMLPFQKYNSHEQNLHCYRGYSISFSLPS